VSRTVLPSESGSPSRSTTPAASNERYAAIACRMCRTCAARGSWLSVSSFRIDAKASPGRAMTLSSMECETTRFDVRGSGSAATSRSWVFSVQETKPSGAFFRTTFRRFLSSSPALASALRFSTS
jgi:hypothetical protein